MAADYKTPGVYTEESNALPGPIISVPTAIPVFIGYTERTDWNGQSLLGQPTRVASLAVFEQIFGREPVLKFSVGRNKLVTFDAGMVKAPPPEENFMLYKCIRLFYSNGGADCYILTLGSFKDGGRQIRADDFTDACRERLTQVPDITLVILPDFASSRAASYGQLYPAVLRHCGEMQNRFALLDVIPGGDEDLSATLSAFRDGVGIEFLNYGAAYYPWLNTSIVQSAEVDFTCLDLDRPEQLLDILPDESGQVKQQLEDWTKSGLPANASQEAIAEKNKILHEALLRVSALYRQIVTTVRFRLNQLPPAAAMAGVYTLVDNSKGVWKAPANISLADVDSPALLLSVQDQEMMTIDVVAGKSVNPIRQFAGKGTLVWGARTLDGNSQDWRYISVRRTVMMMEQSVKDGLRSYIFEPNTNATWVVIKSAITDFLLNLWRQGALAGAIPAQAFGVQTGLGTTMTETDIQQGLLIVVIEVALLRPAEFIVLRFRQQQAN